MLAVDALHFSHPGAPALLADIHFTLGAGNVLCLLGPNGSGKTTLLRCVLGLENFQAGRVLIDGQDLAQLSPALRAKHMAYVPQSSEGAFPFTVFDVVLMGRSAHLRFMANPVAADHQAAHAALARVQIEHLAQRQFNQLSGGERQLALLARALAQQARLLVMDEPCTGLDLGHQVQLLQVLRSLASEGYAILLSTHLPEHAFALDAQVALLQRPSLVGPAPAAVILTPETLSKLYGTRVDLLHITSGPASGQRVCVPVINTSLERTPNA
jgi:iron complex transport system ATP-binding protein